MSSIGTFDMAERMEKWEEKITESPSFIETDHKYIHEGNAFDAWDVASFNGDRVIQFRTPSSSADYPYVHFRPARISIASNSIVFSIYDTGTGALSTGTDFTPVNRNYGSTQVSGVTFRTNATASSGGFSLKYQSKLHAGTGPGQTKIGESKGEPLEWVLEPGTDYAMYLTTTASVEVASNFFWYEEAKG